MTPTNNKNKMRNLAVKYACIKTLYNPKKNPILNYRILRKHSNKNSQDFHIVTNAGNHTACYLTPRIFP